jgi:adenosylhomocysteine nucleosidase
MTEPVIALIAAMPEEIQPLLRRATDLCRETRGGFPCYRFTLSGKSCLLMESGMGPARAEAATRVLLAAEPCAALLNFGFGGAVTAGPQVGDIVIAGRLFSWRDRRLTEEPRPGGADDWLRRVTPEGTGRFAVRRGAFVTTGEIVTKGEMRDLLPGDVVNPLLEMESAAVARVACAAGIPFGALRAVSDDAAEELEFAITDFTDGEMNIRLHRVLLTIAKRPRIIPQLLRLRRNTKLAGENLAAAVAAAVAGL